MVSSHQPKIPLPAHISLNYPVHVDASAQFPSSRDLPTKSVYELPHWSSHWRTLKSCKDERRKVYQCWILKKKFFWNWNRNGILFNFQFAFPHSTGDGSIRLNLISTSCRSLTYCRACGFESGCNVIFQNDRMTKSLIWNNLFKHKRMVRS